MISPPKSNSPVRKARHGIARKAWMDIAEVKRLLKRVREQEQTAQKELNTYLGRAVELLKRGDKRAERVIEFYLTDKIEFLVRFSANVRQADRADVKQDATLAIISNLRDGKFDSELGDLGGYAYRIAQNKIRDYGKKIREQTVETVDDRPIDNSPHSEIGDDERRLIKEAIKNLPAKHKEVLRLHYFEGLKMNEVSEKMRISPQKAYNLKNYALQLLREDLNISDFF